MDVISLRSCGPAMAQQFLRYAHMVRIIDGDGSGCTVAKQVRIDCMPELDLGAAHDTLVHGIGLHRITARRKPQSGTSRSDFLNSLGPAAIFWEQNGPIMAAIAFKVWVESLGYWLLDRLVVLSLAASKVEPICRAAFDQV